MQRHSTYGPQILSIFASSLLIAAMAVSAVSAQPFPARINLASITADDGIVLSSPRPGDAQVETVAGVGDLDGDGLDDVAVGGGASEGEIFVILGNSSVLSPRIDLETLNGTYGFKINDISDWDGVGNEFDGAGDVNGDGFDDLVIGASQVDFDLPYLGAGEAYIVFGQSVFPAAFELSELNGTNGFRLRSADLGRYDFFGSGVAGVGDLNGDGLDDFAIGASNDDLNGIDSGSVFVIYGRASFPPLVEAGNFDGTDGFEIRGAAAYDKTGTSVSAAGDVNRDGFSDLLVGAPSTSSGGDVPGNAYIVFGSDNPMAPVIELSQLDGADGVRLEGVEPFDRAGGEVHDASDLNRDGFDDVVVSARFADPNGNNSGQIYVVLGRPRFPPVIRLAELDGVEGFRVNGIAAGDQLSAAAGAGDFNGDGFDDLLTSSWAASPNGLQSGESYVIFGDTALPEPFELTSLDGDNGFVYEGSQQSEAAGIAVDTAGDFNGDGVADIVLGGGDRFDLAGKARILFGRTETGITLGATGGSCPGTVRFRSKGLTANGDFGIYRGTGRGSTTIEGGACDGVTLDLADAVLSAEPVSDADGRWTFAVEATPESCGIAVQAIDLASCALSNVTTLPESSAQIYAHGVSVQYPSS